MSKVREGFNEVIPSAVYGAAVEHLAAAEFLFRGHEVAWPTVDEGYDLVVDRRVRVQVKAAGRGVLVTGGRAYARYCWTGVGPRRHEGRGVVRVIDRESVDVFALFGAGPDGARRWWIVPAFALGSVAGSLTFLPSSRRGIGPVVASYEDAWHVLEEGFDLTPQLRLEKGGAV